MTKYFRVKKDLTCSGGAEQVSSAQDLVTVLPHRDPFLFLTEAEVIDQKSAIGIACWERDNPVFRGHFPDFPIVPGVFLIEAAAQLSGVLAIHTLRQRKSDPVTDGLIGVLAAVRQCKIHAPVFPGDDVQYKVDISWAMYPLLLANCVATNQGKKTFSVELNISMIDRSLLDGKRETRLSGRLGV